MPKQQKPKEEFKSFKKSNPNLHLFYVQQAVAHLAALEECEDKLEAYSNLNLADAIVSLIDARNKLIKTNEAYKDAAEILDSIRSIKFHHKLFYEE